VIANQTVGGRPLLEQIRTKARNGEAEILVVTPALTSSRLAHWSSDVDGAIEGAQERLERSLEVLRSEGFDARGEVGDSEPNQAISDALLKFGADELIISTLPPGVSHWLEKDVVERAREESDVPVTHVIVDLEAD
jgi:GABA permease